MENPRGRPGPVRDALGVFVKDAVPGAVKTRLAAGVGPEAAARFYRAFVHDLAEVVARVPATSVTVFFAPDDARERCARPWQQLQSGRSDASLRFRAQRPGHLGARLHAAFRQLLRPAGARAVVIGSDCPTLGQETLCGAFAALGRHDLVLGPSRDGGYYLIGLRRPIPRLFAPSLPWSESGLLAATLGVSAQAGLKASLLEPLGDVDEPADLVSLEVELLRAWTRACSLSGTTFPTATLRELMAWGLTATRRLPRRGRASHSVLRPEVCPRRSFRTDEESRTAGASGDLFPA